ncbi:MAG: tRNA lysidine(34) synthetase TilS [Asticcacaulis sp.]|nr:tRNA lysidine(34) synthetase TilS [Asticcacaulis sp.]
MSQAVSDKFPDFAARLDGDGPIGVAVSGGGDSVALFYALAEWGQRPLEAFCVDHGLNPQSAQWTQSVSDHAARVGAGFTALYWQGEKPLTGLAAAARLARHRLLAEAAREKGVSVLCLAHTADDITEAQAMRAQGSNVGAPKAWAPSPVWPEGRNIFLYRPFLDIRRETLRDYLRGIGVVWIDDPANESPQSLRARTRKHLREKPMEAQAPEGETSLTAAQLQALLHLPEMLIPFGMVAFRAEAFDALPRKTALKLLATAAVCAGGGDKLPGREKVAALLENLSSGKPLTLAGTRVCRREDVITLSREAGDIGRNRPGTLSISETGEAVWDGRFAVRSSQPGEIVASGRLRGDLPANDKAWLMRLPADIRQSQPVFVSTIQKDNQNKCLLTNPALRQSDYKVIETRCLVGSRLRAALGLITTESDLVRAKND